MQPIVLVGGFLYKLVTSNIFTSCNVLCYNCLFGLEGVDIEYWIALHNANPPAFLFSGYFMTFCTKLC